MHSFHHIGYKKTKRYSGLNALICEY